MNCHYSSKLKVFVKVHMHCFSPCIMKIKFDNARVADFSEFENKSNGILQMRACTISHIWAGFNSYIFTCICIYSIIPLIDSTTIICYKSKGMTQ